MPGREVILRGRREIGRTGIKVRAVGLGAMPLSIAGRPTEAQAHAVIQAFIDAGGDFIDTANVYCLDDADIGHNERLIRAALTKLQRTGGVRVATKAGLRRPKGEWSVDGAPARLRSSCEQSLRAAQGLVSSPVYVNSSSRSTSFLTS